MYINKLWLKVDACVFIQYLFEWMNTREIFVLAIYDMALLLCSKNSIINTLTKVSFYLKSSDI